MNDSTSSTTLSDWLRGAEAGRNESMNALWQRYYPDLVRFAEQRMVSVGLPRRVADGEDVAASALGSFFRAVQHQRFHDVRDEQGLIRFLFKITVWKVIDRKRKHKAKRAGGGQEVGESALGAPDGSIVNGLEQFPIDAFDHELLVTLEEQVERRMAGLDNEQLRAMVQYRLENYDNAEIAALCHCSVATVERRFRLIRELWAEAAEREQD